jgi:uncharacterized membrane protein
MAKKKVAKKVAMKNEPTCSTQGCSKCNGILALLIIILVWWQPAVMWSQITITISAAIILLSTHGLSCKK